MAGAGNAFHQCMAGSGTKYCLYAGGHGTTFSGAGLLCICITVYLAVQWQKGLEEQGISVCMLYFLSLACGGVVFDLVTEVGGNIGEGCSGTQ